MFSDSLCLFFSLTLAIFVVIILTVSFQMNLSSSPWKPLSIALLNLLNMLTDVFFVKISEKFISDRSALMIALDSEI